MTIWHWLLIFVFGYLMLCVYFLPFLLGRKRRIPHRGYLFVVNLVAGWTLLGWLACILWAALAQGRGVTDEAMPKPRRLGQRLYGGR